MKALEFIKKYYKTELAVNIFFILIIAISLFPIFFGGRMFINADATLYYYPVFDFYSKALKSGESFLWNPQLFSGFPSYISQSAGLLDPVNMLLFKILPTIPAYHLRLFIDLFLVLLFSYLAGKAYGLSRLSSSLVGMSYLLSFLWAFLSNLVISNSLFLLPFLFFIWSKIISSEAKKWLWIIFGGIGIGWAFLSGYTQLNIYAVFLFLIFAIAHYFFIQSSKKNIKSFYAFAWPLFLMVVIGITLALPFILPVLNFIPLTLRSSGLEYAITTFKVINPGDLILFLFPDYLYFPYLSGGRRPLYVGAIWFFLSLVAFFAFAKYLKNKNKESEKSAKTFIIIGIFFIFTLATALRSSPFFYILHQLPVFKYFRFPYRWMYLGTWFLAFTGGYGFDAIKNFIDNKWLRRIFIFFGIIITGITSWVILLNFGGVSFWNKTINIIHNIFSKIIYGHFGLTKDPAHYQEMLHAGIAAWQSSFDLKTASFLVPLIILLISFCVLIKFILGKISWDKFRVLVFCFSTASFIAIFIAQWSNTASIKSMDSHSQLIDNFIPKEDRLVYRTYPFAISNGFSKLVPPTYTLSLDQELALTELQFASGWPNMHMYSGISSVDGYDLFVPKDLLYALVQLGSTHAGGDEIGSLSDNEKAGRLLSNLDLLGMMAGKYIITGMKLNHKDIKLLGEQMVSRYNIPLYIYENKKALPRFYFASNVIASNGKSLTDLLKENINDFNRRTYIDCGDCSGFFSKEKNTLEIIEQKNGFIHLRANLLSAKWLVVSESYLPGWSAELDGSEISIKHANGIYMALMIPSGEHSLVLKYNGVPN